jgi:hypothetical protein
MRPGLDRRFLAVLLASAVAADDGTANASRCGTAEGIAIAFETLGRGESVGAGAREPALIVVENRREARQLARWIGDDALADRLQTAPLQHNVILAVFAAAEGGDSLTVGDVRRIAEDVRLDLSSTPPPADRIRAEAINLSYVVIRVFGDGLGPVRRWLICDADGRPLLPR